MGGTMKKKAFASIALGVAALTAGGCFGHMEFGDDGGPQTKKDVKLSGFTKIKSNGSMDVSVKVGSPESINVEGSEARVKAFKATVVDGVLVLEEDSNSLFGGNDGKLRVTVTVPDLTAFTINGSGDATIDGVKGKSFAISINGSGDATVTGECDDATISVSGSGDINAKSLDVKNATVSIAGSGDVAVKASVALTASVVGSGDVTYFGEAKVTTSVTGSGDINKG
jgi:hypothetical protein